MTNIKIDLGLPSGTLWTDRNVGAQHPEECGMYFRWGEITEVEDYLKTPYSLNITKRNIAGTQYDAATAILGNDYRMPTIEQIKELFYCCKWEWTTINEVKGYKVTGPNNNSIFLPASGQRDYRSGSLDSVGSDGFYWSASAYGSNDGRYLDFYSNYWSWYGSNRANGFPIRAVARK